MAVAALAFVLVYRQFTMPEKGMGTSVPQQGVMMKKQGAPSDMPQTAPVQNPEPKSIDDITANIEAQAAADGSALDDEESGEMSDIESDSQTINDLGEAYDENSL